jgi:hypothetical protein
LVSRNKRLSTSSALSPRGLSVTDEVVSLGVELASRIAGRGEVFNVLLVVGRRPWSCERIENV